MPGVRLFGRDEERRALRDAWARARAGFGGLIVVSGEPGIGKSSLVEELAEEAATAEASVARGRAWDGGDAPAYVPLWPCFRALGLPVLGDRAREAERVGADFRRWEAVLEAAALASRQRPLLWVLDDLHAADAQTLELLAFLAQPLRSMAALVVATMRSADPRLDEPRLRRLARLLRDAHEIALGPLGRDDVAAILRSRVGDVPDRVIDELVARTGGNPLFVSECARGLSAAAENAWRFVALPPTVGASVRERVELLPDATRAALEAAAVLGDEALLATLSRMTGMLPARIIDALAPAVRAGVLVETAVGRFRFAHAIVREVIYDARPAGARAEAHARAAAALAADVSPEAVVERAHHVLASLPASEEIDVRAVVTAAIERLVADGTYDRAERLMERVLEASARGDLPPPTLDDLLTSARLAHAAGNYARARKACLQALSHARAHADAEGLARAALALGADLRPGEIDRVLVRTLDEALSALGPDASGLRCRVEARRAAALQPAPDPEEPVAIARDVIARARATGDDALQREVLLVAGAALTDFAPPEETRALATELLELCRAAGDTPGCLRAYARLVADDGRVGDFSALDVHLDAMLGLARSVGAPRLVWRALLLGSMRALARGELQESERLVTEVRRLSELTDDPALALSLAAHQQAVDFASYREAEAAAGVARMGRYTEVPNVEQVALGMRAVHAVYFRDAASAAALLPTLGVTTASLHRFPLGELLGGVVALAGTKEQCASLAESLAGMAARHVLEGHVPIAYFGPVRWILAQLLARAGEPERAASCYRDALRIARAHGLQPWVARLELELGELAIENGWPDAHASIAHAAELAESLGLPWLAAIARRALEDASSESAAPVATPREAEPSRGPSAFSMTREGDVWHVVLGDREARIADARGLELLARLVERPGEEIHVLVLASDGAGSVPASDAGEVLDARAIESYRARVADLAAQIEDAGERADAARLQRLVREQQFLEHELSRAVGVHGKRRAAASVSERARVNVRRRIKDAIDRVDRVEREIARYLRGAVRTGTYCTFRP